MVHVLSGAFIDRTPLLIFCDYLKMIRGVE
jgi:hypothetical protein